MGDGTKRGYDWTACAVAVAAGLCAMVPLIFAADWLFDSSSLLLVAVFTAIGAAARFAYARLAKPGSRPLRSN